MAKSIKLKNENYIDSTGIVHNKEKLSNILDKTVSDLNETINHFKHIGETSASSTVANQYTKIMSTRFGGWGQSIGAFMIFGTSNLNGFALISIDCYGQGTSQSGKQGIYMLAGGSFSTNNIEAYREEDSTLSIYYKHTIQYTALSIVKIADTYNTLTFPKTVQTNTPVGNKLTINLL